jgi:SM-20-related protein
LDATLPRNMSDLAAIITDNSPPARFAIDVDAFRNAPLISEPFPFVIVPGFIRAAAHQAIAGDYPKVDLPGSFPLSSLNYGPAFARFMDDLQSAEFRDAVAEKFDIDLSAAPAMITVRGVSREADGKIHSDSRTKLITALVYMNEAWETPKGRLRLLRSPTSLDDVAAEVPPERGTLLMFRNTPNAWHGFESFSGPRRVIQLNWVTGEMVLRREQMRHHVSAFMKRLLRRAS